MRPASLLCVAGLAVLLSVESGATLGAQGSTTRRAYAAGQQVIPAYEGWEKNADGSFNLVFGTMNRNWEQELHIPIGPDNKIEPGGPDQGQPTYFLPRRNRFLFKIRVPADFGEKELVWTLTSNGVTKQAYGTLIPDYYMDDVVRMANNGAGIRGELYKNKPPTLMVNGDAVRQATVGAPVTLTAVATDEDGIPKVRPMRATNPASPSVVAPTSATGLRLAWFVYRGPSNVTFDPPQIKVWEDTRANSNSPWGPGWKTPPLPADNTWVVRATFNEPGTYILRCQAHDGGLTTVEDITVEVSG